MRADQHVDHSVGICLGGMHLFKLLHKGRGEKLKLQGHLPIHKGLARDVLSRDLDGLGVQDDRLVGDAFLGIA